jgi:hypothetical protein
MSLRLAESFVNTNVPGAYVDVRVQSTPVGIGASGNILLIGEADGGADFTAETLSQNSFGSNQADRIAAKYLSGPLVDAARILGSPSNDTDITGSANRVFYAKTNVSAKAQSTVDTDYGTLKDQNFGTPGNRYSWKNLQITAESAPTKTGGTVPSLGAALNGATFGIRKDGAAITNITLSGTATDHDTIAELAVEIAAQLPAGMTCAAEGDAVKITYSADAAANRKGWGKSFELIDTDPGDLAALGLTAGLTVSGAEPEVELNIVRPDINANESIPVSADVAFLIGYAGTTATVSITSTHLTTTVTGGAGGNLNIPLANATTLASLAALVASNTGYTCSADPASAQLPPSALDRVTNQPICSTAAGQTPGRIKRAAFNWQKALSTSRYLSFTPTATAGIPASTSAFAFLSGGTKGATTSASIAAALTKAEGISINFVIPLFSRDASADIADGLTDAASTYTIDAVHAAAKNHVLKMSSVLMKRNRVAMCSYKGSYTEAKAKAGTLASYRANMTFQDVTQTDSQNVIKQFQPWMGSVVAAGMQSAGFYKAIVKKFANVISFVDPTGFDSGNPADVSDALDAGLMFLEAPAAGVRWVSDQMTYGFDTNFVYNSLQAVYDSDILSLDFADSLEKAFVGKSLADVDAATVASFITDKMDGYKKLKLIASSDDAPLGYRNVSIEISGPVLRVSVEIKLATAIYFIPIVIEISQVQRAA